MSLPLDDAVRLYGTLHHFFEVAVHSVLYYRRLYPERAFAAATAFGVPVHQSRHPAVCAWVRSAVEETMTQLCGPGDLQVHKERERNERKERRERRGPDAKPPSTLYDRVNAVAVVVHAPFEEESDDGLGPSEPLPAGVVLERWVFDVRHLPRGWPGGVAALRRARKDMAKRERMRRGRAPKTRRKRRHDAVGAGAGAAEGDGHGSYTYYDEQEEMADAESEADLDKLDDSSSEAAEEEEVEGGGGTVNWADLEVQMRGVVQRLAQAGQQLAALPEGCTFTMAIELGDADEGEAQAEEKRGDADGGEAQAEEKRRVMDTHWIPETGNRKRKFGGEKTGSGGDGDGGDSGVGIKGATTTIRSVDSAPFFLECWVEESSVKRAVTEGRSARLALKDKDVLVEGGIDEDDEGEDGRPEEDVPIEIPPSGASVSSYGMDVSFGDIINDSFESPEFDFPGRDKGKGVAYD